MVQISNRQKASSNSNSNSNDRNNKNINKDNGSTSDNDNVTTNKLGLGLGLQQRKRHGRKNGSHDNHDNHNSNQSNTTSRPTTRTRIRSLLSSSSSSGSTGPLIRSVRYFRSLQPRRQLALFIVFISIITSFTTILISDHDHAGFFYNYYNHAIDNTLYSSFTSSSSSFDSNYNGREKALSKAKDQTKQWEQKYRADEYELDNIIVEYKKHLHVLKQQQKERDEKLQEKQQREKADSNSEYYLYYQDSNDASNTIIGIPTTKTSSISSASSSASSNSILYIYRFVKSLRLTGYNGNIIIGLEETIHTNHPQLITFLQQNKVQLKTLLPVECSFQFAKKNQKCYHPYSHIKREWSYFPLARDWLTSCAECIGSVVLASMKETVFQLNPFGIGMPIIQRLHLFEQHPFINVAETSAGTLLKACDDIDIDRMNVDLVQVNEEDLPLSKKRKLNLISAGTALGTRDDIIDYLGAIHTIMREWMHRSQCHFEHSTSDDGMAIVNYLRLSQRLPFRTRIIPHRHGIVNNVGYDGRIIHEAHLYLWQFKGKTEEEANYIPYEGAIINKKIDQGRGSWIDSEYTLTDVEGNFIDVFFQKSAIIHEYNTFGPPFVSWLDEKLNLTLSVVGMDAPTTNPATTTTTTIQELNDGGNSTTTTEVLSANNSTDTTNQHTTNTNDNPIDIVQSNSNITDSPTTTNSSSRNTQDLADNHDKIKDERQNSNNNNDHIESNEDDNNKNKKDDDYYLEENSQSYSTISNTSILTSLSSTNTNNNNSQNRIVHSNTTNLIEATATKVEVEEKKLKEQPMYYKDISANEDYVDEVDDDGDDLYEDDDSSKDITSRSSLIVTNKEKDSQRKNIYLKNDDSPKIAKLRVKQERDVATTGDLEEEEEEEDRR